MIDEILEKVGLKYEDLNAAERETLYSWVEVLEKGQLSIEGVRDYISSMKESVESELSKSDLGSKHDMFLKARLRNYMLLESFLSTPKRAKEAIDRALSGMVGKKVK